MNARRTIRALGALLVWSAAATSALAVDGFETRADVIKDSISWPAVGGTVLAALLVAAAVFKDSKRTHLD
ncbi:MAG: hypothetical protein ACLFVU_14395 [Phycisphaerae bacterium]